MIRTLHISGLGPHESARFDFGPYWTEIRGPSRAGKSTILTALALCFWGEDHRGKPIPTTLIREDATRAEVEAVFESGTSYRRSITRSRTPGMWHNDIATKPGEWDDSLGALAEKDLVRAIVFPLAWVPLAQGAQGGRPLRDLLIDASGIDIDAVIAEQLREGEPRTEDAATARRRAAKQDAAAAAGRLAEAQSALAEVESLPPEPEVDLSAARATMSSHAAWDTYHTAMSAYVDAEEAKARAEEALAGWRRDVEALGPRPKGDGGKHAATLATARKARADAEEALATAESDLRAAEESVSRCLPPTRQRPDAEDAAYQAARSAYAAASSALKALPAGKVCPTCKRDGWDHAEAERQRMTDELAALRKAGEDAKAAKDKAEAAAEEAHAAAMAEHRKQLAVLQSAAKDARGRVDAARESLRRATEAADTAADLAQDPVAAWEARSRALGAEPAIPDVPEKPAEPGAPEPEENDVAAARDAIRDAEVRAAAAERIGGNVEAMRQRVADAEAAKAEADEMAARAEEVVSIIRTAPSRLATSVIELMGDMGPVSLDFTRSGGVDVMVGGLPWWAASRGELVVADMCFRAAIRRMLEWEWLPIVVDNAQDWSDDWPDIDDGPVWLIYTEPGEGISVVADGGGE